MCCTVKQTIISTNLESGLCSSKWGTSKVNQVRVWEQSNVNIKSFIISVPSLETCHRFLIISSITLFHCGSSLPMSNPYPPDMIHMHRYFQAISICCHSSASVFILCKICKQKNCAWEAWERGYSAPTQQSNATWPTL